MPYSDNYNRGYCHEFNMVVCAIEDKKRHYAEYLIDKANENK